MDDIKEWCWTDAQTLSVIAQDCSEWRRVVLEALDTNGSKPMEWNEEEDIAYSLYNPGYLCIGLHVKIEKYLHLRS